MSGEVSVVFTADDAALWNALQRTIAGSTKAAEKLVGIGQGSAAATRDLERLAEATKRLVATPIENYERQIAKLDAALAADKLTVGEHAAAVGLARVQLDAATAAADGTAAAGGRSAAELQRLAGSVKQLVAAPVQHFEQTVAALDAELAAGSKTAEEHAAAIGVARQQLTAAAAAAGSTAAAESRATGEMDRLAASVRKLTATPLQVFEESVKKLDAALAADKLTAEEHAAAVGLARQQLDAATAAADGTAAANAALDRELEKVAQRIKTTYAQPWDKFAKEMDLIDGALERQKITAEEHARATAAAVDTLESETAALDKTALAEADAAREMEQFVAATKKLQRRPVDEYDAAVAKLKLALEKGKLTQREYAAGMQDAANKYAAARQEITKTTGASQGFSLSVGTVVAGARGLATVAMAWNIITTAIDSANQAAEKHAQLAIESKDSQRTVANAQAEAVQNLVGLSTAQKTEVLTERLPAIQAQTGFPDLAKLTQAVGAGYSASGDLAATLSAVKTAAEETALMPDKLATVTAGLLDLARGTGIKDTDALQGFLLQSGAINRIQDPAKLASSLAPLVASGVARLPKQAAPEAAREISALFAVLAGEATDLEGRSTNTAANTLLGKMDTWFKAQNQAVEAAEAKQKTGKPLDDGDRSALAVGRVDTPDTLKSRIEFFQRNERARADLLGTEGFGEQNFRTAIEQVLVAGSRVAEKFAANVPQLSFDAATHRQVVTEQQTATPQLRLAIEAARAKTSRDQQLQGVGRGIEGFVIDDVQDAISKAVPRGIRAAGTAFVEDKIGLMFAKIGSLIDPGLGITAQRNRVDMRINAILQNQLPADEAQRVQAEGNLTSERIDKLPLRDAIKDDLRRLVGAAEGIDRLIKSANASVTPAPAIQQSLATAPLLLPPPSPLSASQPAPGTPAFDQYADELFTPVILPPVVPLPAAARQQLPATVPPATPPGVVPQPAAAGGQAAATPRDQRRADRPQPAASDRAAVSPDTASAAALETAGQKLLAAAQALTAAASKIPTGPPAGQLAAAPRRPAPHYPEYAGAARREQAVAAG